MLFKLIEHLYNSHKIILSVSAIRKHTMFLREDDFNCVGSRKVNSSITVKQDPILTFLYISGVKLFPCKTGIYHS